MLIIEKKTMSLTLNSILANIFFSIVNLENICKFKRMNFE